MLFSATQTKKVEDLARVSMSKRPVFIDVDNLIDQAKKQEGKLETSATVDTLDQGYVIIDSDKRFCLLYTFLKKYHKKNKIIVFLSSCNSVKYLEDLLNYIDLPVLALHVYIILIF